MKASLAEEEVLIVKESLRRELALSDTKRGNPLFYGILTGYSLLFDRDDLFLSRHILSDIFSEVVEEGQGNEKIEGRVFLRLCSKNIKDR